LLNKTPNIAIVILAAGASSRMGSPKQLLQWKHTTLLGHAVETAKALNQTKISVVLGANFELIKSKINPVYIEILKNEDWETGLGKSIAIGVDPLLSIDINIDGVLIMLADQPLIDQSYLQRILDEFKPGTSQIIATAYKNNKQGVPVLFDRIYFEELSKLNDDKGAKVILRNHAEKVSIVNAQHDVSDIDTIEDYNALYRSNH